MPCAHARIITLAAGVRLAPGTIAPDGMNANDVCADCVTLPTHPGTDIHPLDITRIRSGLALGSPRSTAAALGFPRMQELYEAGLLRTVAPSQLRRIDLDQAALNALPDAQLEENLRSTMNFTRVKRDSYRNYPHHIWCEPIRAYVCLHTGIIDKIIETRRDTSHARFAGCIPDAIATPDEIYLTAGESNQDVFHIVSTLLAPYVDQLRRPAVPYYFLTIVECNTGRLTTGFRPEQRRIEIYRVGTPIYLSWAII